MLKRQRTLLTLLRQRGGAAGRLDLIKLAFLLGERGKGGEGFYSFIPYHYGPYSFSLMQEMTALIRDGFVAESDEKSWVLTPKGSAESLRDPGPAVLGITEVLDHHGSLKTTDLVDLVYEKFPWFGLNTKLTSKVRPVRPVAQRAAWTVGYEKLAVEGLLDCLLRSGIATLIDVRRNPLSRRYGFHGSTLRRLCEFVGVGYRHFPSLGIASEERRELSTQASYDKLFEHYEATTLKTESATVDTVSVLMTDGPAAVMCAEADPCQCHRCRLANEVARRSDLQVKHLAWPRLRSLGDDLWERSNASSSP